MAVLKSGPGRKIVTDGKMVRQTEKNVQVYDRPHHVPTTPLGDHQPLSCVFDPTCNTTRLKETNPRTQSS